MRRIQAGLARQGTLVLFFFLAVGIANAGNWQSSWGAEKSDAASRCAKLFDNYQLQAVCMDNEKEGYNKMQGDFGLPNSEAQKAKVKCAHVFAEFQLQAVCMQNEKDGYDKMGKY